MSKTDPVVEQRVSDEILQKFANWDGLDLFSENVGLMARELLTFRSQSAAAAEEWTDKHLFQRVRVDHPCFHGEGELRQIEHARGARLGVLLEHGHIRWYEAETVRLAAPAAAVKEEKRNSRFETGCREEE